MTSRDQVIDEIESLLCGQYVTALEVAIASGCSKPTAYGRVEVLRRRLVEAGRELRVKRVRQGRSGPEAEAFSIDVVRKHAATGMYDSRK